ncbi:MAG: hypothetical protein Q9220_003251 [cf. Caloplaca sp. 1 TL-2023]
MTSLDFRFGFGDEDVDMDQVDDKDDDYRPPAAVEEETSTPTSSPCVHDLQSLLTTLPSHISYNTIAIHNTLLPRRELFDIRAQLMAEDVDLGDDSNTNTLAGLSTDDIKPNIYEGGFKTWECSIDLASYLTGHTSDLSQFATGPLTILEMGAGTALPTLVLFRHLLSSPPSSHSHPRTIILADFNLSVLQLATIPNLLLTYALSAELIPPESGDLEITPALLASFQKAIP